MSSPRTLTAAVHQEEDWYVAQCLEVEVGGPTMIRAYPFALDPTDAQGGAMRSHVRRRPGRLPSRPTA